MRKLLAAAVLAFGFGCGASEAATLTLTATPSGIFAAFYSGFSVSFNDADNDNRVDASEVTGFSGIFVIGTFWDKLSQVGTVSGFTDVGSHHDWIFKGTAYGSATIDADPSYFTYAISTGGGADGAPGGDPNPCDPIAVPEPATWTLMIAGFAGLGLGVGYRRRARSAQSI